MKKHLIGAAVTALAASFATGASAQSSVTLYGVVDAGFTYVNNVFNQNPNRDGIKSNFIGMTGGNVQQSRWGMRGAEDLGGGMKAIFVLESGFNLGNGTLANGGGLFNRQAYVGVSSQAGTLTLGRQYDSTIDYLAPISAAGTWGGTYFGHIGGNDNLNSNFSIANSVKFQTANYAGFSASALYGFSNQAGNFSNNRAYSVGAGYANGPFKFGLAYMQANGVNSATNQGGAVVGNQYASLADNQIASVPGRRLRTFGAGAGYSCDAMTFGLLWTQSRLDSSYFSGNSTYVNNYEINGRYMLSPALSLGAAYTYSQGRTAVAGNSAETFRWHQFGIQADYSLSKRTDVYVEGVGQLGSGGAAAWVSNNGTFGPSSSSRQVVVSTGMRHRF
ncbi:porin [Caballeronia cordobensis]|uniref:porin n=1 Tax=Caballeronia cordobensis TaxID=1353886 RepID=UPI00045EDF2D|nr:porin Gram-negative type [Burkholderia sp. RPE67]BBP95155.1 porin [Burkholderia sp. SFA1]